MKLTRRLVAAALFLVCVFHTQHVQARGPSTREERAKVVALVNQQVLFSGAAFTLERQDKARDDIAVYTAGVEGALRVYEVLTRSKPDAKLAFLDDLVTKGSRPTCWLRRQGSRGKVQEIKHCLNRRSRRCRCGADAGPADCLVVGQRPNH